MRLTRLFIDVPLMVGQELQLPDETAHYVTHVLRLKRGAPLTLFNGQGGEYGAFLVGSQKNRLSVHLHDYQPIERESPLQLTLVQAISRPEHMDYTIQKAVELGVQCIVPVQTQRSRPLDKLKSSKREERWRKIIGSACEQCGRNRLPTLHQVIPLSEWFMETVSGQRFVLSPFETTAGFKAIQGDSQMTVLVGAEGGLTEMELDQAKHVGYLAVRLGPRILRTETAALAIMALCQAVAGDWV